MEDQLGVDEKTKSKKRDYRQRGGAGRTHSPWEHVQSKLHVSIWAFRCERSQIEYDARTTVGGAHLGFHQRGAAEAVKRTVVGARLDELQR